MSSFFTRNKIESGIAKTIFAILSFCNESLGFLLFYEDEREIAGIIELRQSGMNITAKFLEDLPGTMRREIFRKTM